jgi:hypothetical protein
MADGEHNAGRAEDENAAETGELTRAQTTNGGQTEPQLDEKSGEPVEVQQGTDIVDTAAASSNSSSTLEDPPADTSPKSAPKEPEASRTKLQTTIIVLSLCASVFLAALDISIITTALPTISEHFHSNAGYTWIGSAYLLANAASTPLWGKFSDIWGRKPILLIAAAIFFVGSLLAAVSVSIGMLIVARAIQGIGGGGLIILVNISISDLFSMRNRGTYFGIIGMVWAFASAIGPIVGGAFTEKVSWRWCFYVNCKLFSNLDFGLQHRKIHADKISANHRSGLGTPLYLSPSR